jgi:AraC family transcriptional regulator
MHPYIGHCGSSHCGIRNVVLTGATTHCHVAKFADPVSLKAVCIGEVEWRLDGRRYLIQPDTVLLLPDGDEYELTIDSTEPSRGFNVVFRRGLVEDCWRSTVVGHEALLDAPYELQPLLFGRRLESRSGCLGRALDALAAAVAARAEPEAVEPLFERLAEQAARSICEQRGESRRLTAIKVTTRREIYRRLCLAREVIESDLAAPWTLVSMARAGMMAPHHFHRSFRATFGETPRDWLSRRRAERSMALLRTTRRSVTEICLSVGFVSTTSFSASFAARYGLTPSRVARPRLPAGSRDAGGLG